MGRSIAAMLLSVMIVSCVPQTDPAATSPPEPLPTIPPPATDAPGRPSPSIEVPPPISVRADAPAVV